jgi:hypothetical protein
MQTILQGHLLECLAAFDNNEYVKELGLEHEAIVIFCKKH